MKPLLHLLSCSDSIDSFLTPGQEQVEVQRHRADTGSGRPRQLTDTQGRFLSAGSPTRSASSQSLEWDLSDIPGLRISRAVSRNSFANDPADSPARKQALEEAAWRYAATLEGVSAASLLPPVVSTTALTPLPTMTDARGTGEMSHANILAEITEALS